MSRRNFALEKGIDIYAENGALLVSFLTGTAAPDGLGEQAAAPIGSLYTRSGSGELYQKVTNAGAAADWQLINGTGAQIGKWRGGLKVVTNDTIANGARDLSANPFSDDDGTLLTAADFAVGQYVIGGAGSSPVLRKVTAVSAPNVTFGDPEYPLASNDTFVADNYLPDAVAAQEGKAIVNYNGSVMVKIADIDWAIATAISLSGSYAAASGNPLAGDSVETAIAKIDGNVDAINSATGLAQGASDFGSWSSPVDLLLAANSNAKALFQRLGDLLMQLRGVQVAGITTQTVVDQVPVASVKAVKWLLTVSEDATPANRKSMEIFAANNTTSADDTQYAKLNLGANFNLSVTVDVSGGNMRLNVASTSAGVTAIARRLEVVKSVL